MDKRRMKRNALVTFVAAAGCLLARMTQSTVVETLLKNEWKVSIVDKLYLLLTLVIYMLMESGFIAAWLIIHKLSALVVNALQPDSLTWTVCHCLGRAFEISAILIILVATVYETKKTLATVIAHSKGGRGDGQGEK